MKAACRGACAQKPPVHLKKWVKIPGGPMAFGIESVERVDII